MSGDSRWHSTPPVLSRGLLAKFLSLIPRVDDDTACWAFPTRSKRHAAFSLGHGESVSAHRIALLVFRGQWPDPAWHVIHHACQNPHCVNPRHLQVLDRHAHGRIHHRLKTEGL